MVVMIPGCIAVVAAEGLTVIDSRRGSAFVEFRKWPPREAAHVAGRPEGGPH